MKEKYNQVKESIADKLDLTKDFILDKARITIEGDSSVTIENHKGISVFGKKELQVKTIDRKIVVKGDDLEIEYMGGNTLIIRGKIYGMNYGGIK